MLRLYISDLHNKILLSVTDDIHGTTLKTKNNYSKIIECHDISRAKWIYRELNVQFYLCWELAEIQSTEVPMMLASSRDKASKSSEFLLPFGKQADSSFTHMVSCPEG